MRRLVGRRWRTSLLTGGMSLLFVSGALAQERRFEVTGFMGALSISHDLGSIKNIYFTTTGTAENVSFGRYYGFRVTYLLSPYIGVEGSLSRGTNSYRLSVDDGEAGKVALGEQFDVSQFNFGGNVLLQYALDNGFAPYATAGLGRQRNRPLSSIEGIQDGVTGTDFYLGGGVRYFFEEQDFSWLGVRFDFRYHFISKGIAFKDNVASPRHTELTFGAVLRPF